LAVIRGASGLDIRVIGLVELQAQFERLEKMPKKYLTKAAKAGMADPERTAKANAPVGKTGNLKKSIKKKMETPNKRNKSVYRLRYDPKYTPEFLKTAKRPGLYGGKSPAYYPASVEYGRKRKVGRVEGKYHMAKAIQQHQQSSLQKVVDSLNASLRELL
jgi:hypothetical protein